MNTTASQLALCVCIAWQTATITAAECDCPNGTCCDENTFAGPTPEAIREGHVVPTDKQLDPAWVRSLTERGRRKVYRGPELLTIGMPCGGVGAGQLYVRGDGTLAKWFIFNNARNERHCSAYQTWRPKSPLLQGFAVRVQPAGGQATERTLSEADFDAIEFVGEYPIAEIHYRCKDRPPLPVDVRLEVFSPWIPLNARDSANPATVLRFTVENTSEGPVDASIAGWLQNGVCLHLLPGVRGQSRNTAIRRDGLTGVRMDLIDRKPPAAESARPDVPFDDFESGTYQKWIAEGTAMGRRPSKVGEIYHPQAMQGHQGRYLVDSLGPRDEYDKPTGKLVSKPFRIQRAYVNLLIGGGNHPGKTCLNLLVDGKVVRTATGDNTEQLRRKEWNVRDLVDREAVLEIVDDHTGGWGHVMVDEIVQSDRLCTSDGGFPAGHPGLGDMTLVAMDADATVNAGAAGVSQVLADLADNGKLDGPPQFTAPLGDVLCGAVASAVRLAPGETKDLTFLLTWYFPNRRLQQGSASDSNSAGEYSGPTVGNMYANWYTDSLEVAQYVAANFPRLDRDTHLARDTYFDTTLPYWFVHRVGMPVANLATETVQWWRNGRFYGWEGVGCCPGTCTHVWHYEQTTGRLFPELSRSMLLNQHLGTGFDSETGLVGFRGEFNRAFAADGQAGVVLMLYRQHLAAPDGRFLDATWPKIKKIIRYMIRRDGDVPDGILATSDHTTYDINFEGPNTHNGSMYLAALRACEEMGRLQGDEPLAAEYRAIYDNGRKLTVERQFNGDYFIQLLAEDRPTKNQIGTGCLTSQLLGNGWAYQLDLGAVYPQPAVDKTLRSIFRYNWTPDVGPYYDRHPPEMTFVNPGEPGLLICTYPLGSRLAHPLRYRNTIMQGYDYDAANQMLYHGMLREGLAVYRANHDNYDGTHHNPWNEVQCGEHYARAMAAWGGLIAISGYVYDGPAGKIGFAPRFRPHDFKAFFTAAEGWGSLVQRREGPRQTGRIELKWGTLRAKTLVLELPQDKELQTAQVTAAGRQIAAIARHRGRRVELSLAEPIVVTAGETVEVVLRTR
ncbi:MAG: hypothetical protein HQ567_30260 [Candidatus Nealsonbacteria bacterium]|nr:hypothetical protein [Candidatus Nealsonbacteria bacterium]